MSSSALRRDNHRCRGASMIGVGLLIGLVAVGSITAVGVAGGEVSRLFDHSASVLQNGVSGEAPSGPAANRSPVAGDVALSGNLVLGESRTVSADALLASSSDPDGDSLEIIGVGEASSGTVSPSDGGAVFTPAADGMQSFSFTISDGRGGTASASATVNVVSGNQPPTVVGVSLERIIYPNPGSASYSVSDLLVGASDPEDDTMQVTAVSGGVNGTPTLAGGMVTFEANGEGSASFTFMVSDGNSEVAGTATIEVKTPTSCGAWQDNKTPTDSWTILQSWTGVSAGQCLENCESVAGAAACDQNKSSGNCRAWGDNPYLTGSTSYRATLCSGN